MKKCLVLGVVLALFGAGCEVPGKPVNPPGVPAVNQSATSTPSSSATSTQKAPTPTTTAPKPVKKPAPKPVATTIQVNIKNMAFSPANISLFVGDSVVWTNSDSVSHTVTGEVASIWDSGNLLPGKVFKKTFPYTGIYNYHCNIHPGMTGTITVRERP